MPDSPESNSRQRRTRRARTGAKHRLNAPLVPPQAFRCAHWLATLSFINIEKKHTGSLESWAKGFWYNFNNFTWEKTIVKQGTTAGASIGIGVASFAIITAIGTVVGGPIGAAIGIGVGAVISGGSAAVSLGIGAIVDTAYHKYAKEKIDDRITRNDYRERSSEPKDQTKTEPGYFLKLEEAASLHQISDRLDVSPLKIWQHERNKELKAWIVKKAGDSAPSEYPIPKQKKVWIPSDEENEPGVGDFRYEARKLTRLVQHSLRDSSVHLRHSLAIYQKMPERMTGGRYYAPGAKETYEDALINMRKQYPKFEFLDDGPLYHSKNLLTLHKCTVRQGDTLESIAEREDCPWHDILEYEENSDLRWFYLNKKLWPEKEENRKIPLAGIRNLWIPVGIVPNDHPERVRIYEYDGELQVQSQIQYYYLPEGRPIWIPAARTLTLDNFKDCDDMLANSQIAFEFIHHLNKFRNYLLPSLNLCRLYLDVFDEFDEYREHAHNIIEDAVLEYAQFGDHKKCNMGHHWQTLLENWEITKRGSWLYWIFGPNYKPIWWKCVRVALQKALKESGKPRVYTVESDDETFDSIALKHKVAVQTLIALNYRKRKIENDKVAYNNKDHKWEIKQTTPGKGTKLEIPRQNGVDRLVYSDVWGSLGISPTHETNKFQGDFKDNYSAQVSIAEVDIADIKKELDEMISSYYDRLNKNRETHQKGWHEAPEDERRYLWMVQDVLHGLDMPGLLTRISHKFKNLDFKYTAGEKTVAAIDASVSIIGSALTSAVSSGASAGAKALFPQVGVMDAIKDLFLDKPGEAFGRYLGKEGISKGTWAGAKGTKALIGLGITKGGGKAQGAEDKKSITRAHRLNFRKERIAVAAQLTSQGARDKEQKSLKYATKRVDELFLNISRHAHWAFVTLQHKLVPLIGKLENNDKELAYGIESCQEAVQCLRTLYEYQHQVDKMERYLVSSLALVKHLFDFEVYLGTLETDLRGVLAKSAGDWTRQDNHARCKRSKFLGKRYCYGPGEKIKAKPHRPLRSRGKGDRPDRPSKDGRKPVKDVRKKE